MVYEIQRVTLKGSLVLYLQKPNNEQHFRPNSPPACFTHRNRRFAGVARPTRNAVQCYMKELVFSGVNLSDRLLEELDPALGLGGPVVILSVSRRTDIPAFYSDWFFRRLREGFVLVGNPMNAHQVSRVSLDPSVIDCIVFWTKDPSKMLDKLHLLEDYQYYFQITITPYGKQLEPGLPPKDDLVVAFRELAERIGKERVIWRYDPIIFTTELDVDFHTRAFAQLASSLAGYTERCVISFLDLYQKTARNIRPLGQTYMTEANMRRLAANIAPIARDRGLVLETCSEKTDLATDFGIRHGKCIDPELISRIVGQELSLEKDPYQRAECGCVSSIDIGAYNTCPHGCLYCYANFNQRVVADQVRRHNPSSPLLVGEISTEDKITEREMVSLASRQLKLF